jgi:hypothetical protein
MSVPLLRTASEPKLYNWTGFPRFANDGGGSLADRLLTFSAVICHLSPGPALHASPDMNATHAAAMHAATRSVHAMDFNGTSSMRFPRRCTAPSSNNLNHQNLL